MRVRGHICSFEIVWIVQISPLSGGISKGVISETERFKMSSTFRMFFNASRLLKKAF